MAEPFRAAVLRLFRVPPEPTPPAGDPARVRVFRAAPNFFRYLLVRWLLGQAGALLGLLGGLAFLRTAPRWIDQPYVLTILTVVEGLAWLGYLIQLPFSFALLRLDFDLRWYILSDRSLRIREGILSVREKTMTFANIQNLSIRQGPLQRLLGISDVEVRTAGGGSSEAHGGKKPGEEGMHVAYFRGVNNAEEIRDTIRERVRLHRDAGLGDPDDEASAIVEPRADTDAAVLAGAGGAAAVAAARELLLEVRALGERAGPLLAPRSHR